MAVKSTQPSNIPGPDAFGLDEETTEVGQGPLPPPPSPPPPPLEPPPPADDDDELDLAKTHKLERADPAILAQIATAEAAAAAERKASESEAAESDYEQSAEETGGKASRKSSPTKRRKGRKGKRRMVKIPDDSVPATPTPLEVSTASDGQSLDALRDLDDDALKIPDSDPIDSEARPTLPHDQDPGMDGGEDTGSDAAASTAASSDQSASDEGRPLDEPTEDIEDELSQEEVQGMGARESAPGVFTDGSAIAVLRPIQVTNDLPAVASIAEEIEPEPDSEDRIAPPPPPRPSGDGHSSSTTAGRPLPPRKGEFDDIEEIVPDRMSMPLSKAADPADQISSGMFEQKDKRPLPPPRAIGVADATGQQQAISAADLARMSQPAEQSASLSAAESDLELAEARALEAEARANELAAKARAAQAAADAAKKVAERPKKRPWWVEMFEDDNVRTLDNPRKHDVEKECTFIEKSLRLEQGARVLDLACGTGVHAVELSTRGYQVVGVDMSKTMLDLANAYNTQRGASVSFIHGDMRQLNLEGVFDSIYCWGASFGYFDDHTNAQVLERVARALRPGGTFVLDVPNRDFHAPRAPSMAWFDQNGCVCMDEMKFDFYSSRMISKRMVLFDNGKSREIEMTMRLYTLHELGRLLHQVGFRVLEVSGHRAHRGAYFGAESERTMIAARVPKEESKSEQPD